MFLVIACVCALYVYVILSDMEEIKKSIYIFGSFVLLRPFRCVEYLRGPLMRFDWPKPASLTEKIHFPE